MMKERGERMIEEEGSKEMIKIDLNRTSLMILVLLEYLLPDMDKMMRTLNL